LRVKLLTPEDILSDLNFFLLSLSPFLPFLKCSC
jgi:hypothetical protein